MTMDNILWWRRKSAEGASVGAQAVGIKDEGSSPDRQEKDQDPKAPFTVGDMDRVLHTAQALYRAEREEEYKRARSRSRRKWFWSSMIIGAVIAWFFFSGDGSEKIPIDQAVDVTLPVLGGGKGKAIVAVIPITGEISGKRFGPAVFSNTVRYIAEALLLAKEEKHLVGVIFDIDSPGGGLSPSEKGHRYVKQFCDEFSAMPVIAYVSEGAFSGGMYIALGARRIILDPSAEAGNIGVISHSMNTFELGKMLGVKEVTNKTGPHKDAGDQWKEDNAADREMEQRSMDAAFHRFLVAVSESRKIPIAQLEAEAKKQNGVTSGAWFDAQEAKARGLADDVMTIEEVYAGIADKLGALRKYDEVEFVRYDEKMTVVKKWEKGVESTAKAIGKMFTRGILMETERPRHSLRAE